MSEQILKDRHGMQIGRIRTRSDGTQEICDRHGMLQGIYDPRNNQTKDRHGAYVGSGNLLTSLL